ncbi:MAG: hypothetical protein ABJG68_17370 [Crocinitomicaceae bacterium]
MLNLAPHSRLWIYQADRKLTDDEKNVISTEMKDFISKWASHGNELYGDCKIEFDYFLMVGADESKSPTSGCSIDSLTRKVKDLGDQLNIDFFNRMNIAYEDEATDIHLIGMGHFKDLMKKDLITGQTTVYNNLIDKVGDLDTKWRTTVSNSWHKDVLVIR